MFLGHYALAFGSKKVSQAPSLGTMFFATQFIDLLWPLFLIAGIERVEIKPGISEFNPLDFVYYPFTHSLAGTLFWAVLFGVVYYFATKNKKGAYISAGLVLSHWFLDLLSHIPDLPIAPGSETKLGLGLWNSIPLTIIVEGLLFAAGLYIYTSVTKAKNKKGSLGLYSLAGFFVLIYIMSIFGPPPENDMQIAYSALALYPILLWAYWVDRNREGV